MDLSKRRTLLNGFSSQFYFYPLVGSFVAVKNNEINQHHEKCSQIMYSNKKSTFIDYWKWIFLFQFINES